MGPRSKGKTGRGMRWFHRKVAGHPTQYELECFAYMAAKDKVWGQQAEAWINPRALNKLEFTNEYMCEPVPPEPS